MRPRAGEVVCALAAAGLFPVLFMQWTDEATEPSGWESLWIGTQLLADLTMVLAVVLLAVIVTKQTVAAQVVLAVVTVWAGLLTMLFLVIDVAGLAADDDKLGDVGLLWPAYAAIALSFLVTAGAWRSMADERLDSSESAVTPPPARPLPKS